MTVRGGIDIVILEGVLSELGSVLSVLGRVRVMGPPEDGEEMRRERRAVVVCSRVCRAELGALATCKVAGRQDVT